jgi:pyridoxine 5-phosphate synthase
VSEVLNAGITSDTRSIASILKFLLLQISTIFAFFYNDSKQHAMTRLSVNINKIATLRNARGGNIPDVIKAAIDCQRFGAEGITVHPRPDERHIRYQDVRDIKKIIKTEFNIEGYPSVSFNELVMSVLPDQVTLVPDPPDAITSNQGWDTVLHQSMLTDIIALFILMV